MKNILLIACLIVASVSSAQSDYPYSFKIRISGINNENDLKGYRFGFIDGNTTSRSMVFDSGSKKFSFSGYSDYQQYYGYVVIEKNDAFMVIRFDNSTWLKTVRIKFRQGNFAIKGKKVLADTGQKPNIEMTELLDISIIPE